MRANLPQLTLSSGGTLLFQGDPHKQGVRVKDIEEWVKHAKEYVENPTLGGQPWKLR